MSIFSKRFAKSLVREAEELPPPVPPVDDAPGGDMSDADAFASTLDAETSPEDFNDIEGAQAEVDNLQAAEKAKQSEVINNWITKLDEVAEFLNGMDPGSMQSQLSDSPCDSLLDSISKSETKKITRIAQEVSALKEALKGYINSADTE